MFVSYYQKNVIFVKLQSECFMHNFDLITIKLIKKLLFYTIGLKKSTYLKLYISKKIAKLILRIVSILYK